MPAEYWPRTGGLYCRPLEMNIEVTKLFVKAKVRLAQLFENQGLQFRVLWITGTFRTGSECFDWNGNWRKQRTWCGCPC